MGKKKGKEGEKGKEEKKKKKGGPNPSFLGVKPP